MTPFPVFRANTPPPPLPYGCCNSYSQYGLYNSYYGTECCADTIRNKLLQHQQNIESIQATQQEIERLNSRITELQTNISCQMQTIRCSFNDNATNAYWNEPSTSGFRYETLPNANGSDKTFLVSDSFVARENALFQPTPKYGTLEWYEMIDKKVFPINPIRDWAEKQKEITAKEFDFINDIIVSPMPTMPKVDFMIDEIDNENKTIIEKFLFWIKNKI